MKKEYYFATADGCTISDFVQKSTENIEILHFLEFGEQYISFGRCDKTGLEAISSQWDYEKFPKFWFVDKNRYRNYMLKDGTCEKTKRIKRTRRIYSSLVGSGVKCMKSEMRTPKVYKKDLKKHPNAKLRDIFIPDGLPLLHPMFKRFNYYFSDKLPFYRFALHIPHNSGKKIPLVINLHGAIPGSTNFDNYLHMADLDPITKFRLFKKKCYILMPRTPYCVPYHEKEFDEILWTIIDGIDEKYGNIDRERIYICGGSWGGEGTLVQLVRHPERFAAATVFASGFFIEGLKRVPQNPDDPLIRCLDDELAHRIAQTPLCLMCSTGDKWALDIGDKIYEMLTGINAEPKYTKKSFGPHAISIVRFRMQKDWIEWLFSKSKPS
jgi:pimeloyl-ACP methyl ester carboxylesterase